MFRFWKIITVLIAFLVVASASPVIAQQSLRLDAGVGYADLEAETEFGGQSDDFDFDGGLGFAANLWVDKVGAEWLSLGIGYSRSDNDWDYSTAGTIFGAAYAGTASLEATTDAFLVNIAARKNNGKFHPYAGAGVGMALTDVDATASATITVGGQTWRAAGSASDDNTGLAYQLFGGLDFDITEKVYVGGRISWMKVDADVFESDVENDLITALAVIGIKF